jgi:outer membrane protein TolC
VQLANLETEKRKVVNSISNGYYGLKVLLGMPVKDELILTDSLGEDQIKEGVLEKTNYTYADRKEFQYALIGKQLNEFNVKRYELSKIPTFTLNGNYAKNAQRGQWDFTGPGDWFTISSVSINMSIPIFNGFLIRSKLGQAKIQLETVNNEIEALKLSIDNDVAVSTNNFKSAIADIDFQKRNMALAETVYNQTKKKYEAGTGSQVDIDLAQTNLKEAQTNYVSALYDAVIAKIDFLKATGKLE